MADHDPLVALDIVVQVDLRLVDVEVDVELEAVVRPRAELQRAVLVVEREVGDVDDARRLEDRLRDPQDRPVVLHDGRRVAMFAKTVVGTATGGGGM